VLVVSGFHPVLRGVVAHAPELDFVLYRCAFGCDAQNYGFSIL
jgi:hypothetical protein